LHNADYFAVLVRSIISQQISTRAAAAIRGRLETALGPAGLTAEAVKNASDTVLRAAGLSRAKRLALADLSHRVTTGELPIHQLQQMSDEDVIGALLPVRGIGRWTAQMFLIFSLGRNDVLPVDDLGLRVAVRQAYRLRSIPERVRLEKLAEPWRPYRSIATWYLWRTLGAVPQSDQR
jgi:DNA-3-methyladenine glycosylase II